MTDAVTVLRAAQRAAARFASSDTDRDTIATGLASEIALRTHDHAADRHRRNVSALHACLDRLGVSAISVDLVFHRELAAA